MPTIYRWKGYRFFFWAGDKGEPPHVHVKKDRAEAKIWLSPIGLAKQIDFADHEINQILRKTEEKQQDFLKAWSDFFGH